MASDQAGPPAGVAAPRLPAGEHHTVVATDVVDFTSPRRTDEDRLRIRESLRAMMGAIFGDQWRRWPVNDRGDGHLVAVPPDISTATAADWLLGELPRELKRRNRDVPERECFRMRLGIDVGPVTGDGEDVNDGVAGSAINYATRLVDANELKQRLEKSTGAILGVIVSEFVYERVISQAGRFASLGQWERVEIENNGLPIWAWILLV